MFSQSNILSYVLLFQIIKDLIFVCIVQIVDLLAILQKSLDRALFLYSFMHEARSSGVKINQRGYSQSKSGLTSIILKYLIFPNHEWIIIRIIIRIMM